MGIFCKIFLIAVTVLAIIHLASGVPSLRELFPRSSGSRPTRYGAEVFADYIYELQERCQGIFMRLEKNENNLYLTNPENIHAENDRRIFRETQIKRILRANTTLPLSPFVSTDLKKRLAYFSQDEDKHPNTMIYQKDTVIPSQEKGWANQNIGHSTQFIQFKGLNILTDPVYGHLSPNFYPQKTESHPSIEELPEIHVILISHNHRDHVDKKSLRDIVEYLKDKYGFEPVVLVPLGDKLKFQKQFWFSTVYEVDWFTKISIGNVNIISIPANHRSGRIVWDSNRSLVTGWIINPRNEEVIIKYSGDTAPLSDYNQKAVDAVLWNEIRNHKEMNEEAAEANKNANAAGANEKIKIPRIIFLEPSGPNYTQEDMIRTHQPTSYSTLLKFIEAQNLAALSHKSFADILTRIITIIIHQNKYELGPDRFDEGIFVVLELLKYLNMDILALAIELDKERAKLRNRLDYEQLRSNTPFTSIWILNRLPEHTSLLIRSYDFIIKDIQKVVPNLLKIGLDRNQIIDNIVEKTLFPRIGQRLDEGNLNSANFISILAKRIH